MRCRSPDQSSTPTRGVHTVSRGRRQGINTSSKVSWKLTYTSSKPWEVYIKWSAPVNSQSKARISGSTSTKADNLIKHHGQVLSLKISYGKWMDPSKPIPLNPANQSDWFGLISQSGSSLIDHGCTLIKFRRYSKVRDLSAGGGWVKIEENSENFRWPPLPHPAWIPWVKPCWWLPRLALLYRRNFLRVWQPMSMNHFG